MQVVEQPLYRGRIHLAWPHEELVGVNQVMVLAMCNLEYLGASVCRLAQATPVPGQRLYRDRIHMAWHHVKSVGSNQVMVLGMFSKGFLAISSDHLKWTKLVVGQRLYLLSFNRGQIHMAWIRVVLVWANQVIVWEIFSIGYLAISSDHLK
jgi:hypothetical protein